MAIKHKIIFPEVEGFSREELQKVKTRASKLAEVKGTNPSWVRVYLRLADAANELDAYLARSEERKD
jgi:hypothetical protein